MVLPGEENRADGENGPWVNAKGRSFVFRFAMMNGLRARKC